MSSRVVTRYDRGITRHHVISNAVSEGRLGDNLRIPISPEGEMGRIRRMKWSRSYGTGRSLVPADICCHSRTRTE